MHKKIILALKRANDGIDLDKDPDVILDKPWELVSYGGMTLSEVLTNSTAIGDVLDRLHEIYSIPGVEAILFLSYWDKSGGPKRKIVYPLHNFRRCYFVADQLYQTIEKREAVLINYSPFDRR